MKIKNKDKKKYKDKSEAYIAGKGKLLPKWLQAPKIDSDFLNQDSEVKLTEELCKELYPFDKGTSEETKLRILLVLRLSCLLGGLDVNAKELKAIIAWVRQIVDDSDELQNKIKNE